MMAQLERLERLQADSRFVHLMNLIVIDILSRIKIDLNDYDLSDTNVTQLIAQNKLAYKEVMRFCMFQYSSFQ